MSFNKKKERENDEKINNNYVLRESMYQCVCVIIINNIIEPNNDIDEIIERLYQYIINELKY